MQKPPLKPWREKAAEYKARKGVRAVKKPTVEAELPGYDAASCNCPDCRKGRLRYKARRGSPTGRTYKPKTFSWFKTDPPSAAGQESYVKIKSASVDIDPKALSFEVMRELIDQFLQKNPKDGKKLWDCMATVRGPDQGIGGAASPCDGSDSVAEHKRVARKKQTCTIIRGRLFPGTTNCSSADINSDPSAIVQLPKKAAWDHYDKHVFKTCQHLGIPYKVDGEDAVQNALQEKVASSLLQKYALKAGGTQLKATFPGADSPSQLPNLGTNLRVVSQGFGADQYVVKGIVPNGSGFQNYLIEVLDYPATAFKSKVWQIVEKVGTISFLISEVIAASTAEPSKPKIFVPSNKWGFTSAMAEAGKITPYPITEKYYQTLKSTTVADSTHLFDTTKHQLLVVKPNNTVDLFYSSITAPVEPAAEPLDEGDIDLPDEDDVYPAEGGH